MFMTDFLCPVCVVLVYLDIVKVLNESAARFKCFYLYAFCLRGHSGMPYTCTGGGPSYTENIYTNHYASFSDPLVLLHTDQRQDNIHRS